MKIIISPAKKMRVDTDFFTVNALPKFIEDARSDALPAGNAGKIVCSGMPEFI